MPERVSDAKICTRSLTDRTKASDAFNAGSIPVGCIFLCPKMNRYLSLFSFLEFMYNEDRISLNRNRFVPETEVGKRGIRCSDSVN